MAYLNKIWYWQIKGNLVVLYIFVVTLSAQNISVNWTHSTKQYDGQLS